MQSKTFDFIGAAGQKLAGRLDLPDHAPRGYALFAHCFTCTKNSLAAVRIARALAARGFGVLRFDFTGLGGSLEDVVRTRILLRDVSQWEPVSRVHGRYFGDIRPANTLVEVGGLVGDYDVEIEAEAVVG